MRISDLQVDRSRLADVCREHDVDQLEVFGSFARGAASPTSDIDLLVTYSPSASVGLRMVDFHVALESLFGRRVDLLTRASVERSPNKYFRRFALEHTEQLYARPRHKSA